MLALAAMIGFTGLAYTQVYLDGVDVGVLRLEEVLPILNMDNEQWLRQDSDYSLTAELVAKIRDGKEVTPAQLDFGKRYCESVLGKIGTSRKRFKLLRQMMRNIDDDILMAVDRIRGIDEYDGRKVSVRCRQRLKSLLGYSAQKHAEYLKVFDSVK